MFGNFKIVEDLNKKILKINVTGKYLENFKNIMLKKIGIAGVNSIIKNSIGILEQSLNTSMQPNSKMGIVYGKVQSGKTSNFLGLISLAFDNSYNVVIIIGGFDIELLSQNIERINDIFNKDKSVIMSDNKLHGYSSKQWEDILKINNEKKVIITALKNKIHLQKINKLFEESEYFKNLNILIIDDEGDQASLNANYNTSKKYPTTIYNIITNLIKNLNFFSYISVTATPFAPLLIPRADTLSPDFISLVYPGNGYIGLEYFHGEENNSKYVRIIPEDETEILDPDTPASTIKSFEKALSTFLVGSTLKEDINNDKDDISEMLVHCERKIDNHSLLYKDIKDKIDSLKELSSLSVQNLSYKLYIDFINYGFNEYFKRDFDEKNSKDINFLKKISNRILKTDVIVKNSSKEFKDRRTIFSLYQNIIYIGANLLERGITIDNLLITYITRRAKNISNLDTVLQRARWFGYRQKYAEYIRIYCTKRINDDFKQLLTTQEDLWFDLDTRINNEGQPLKEWFREIKISDNKLRPTRLGVAKVEYVAFNFWNNQDKYWETSDLEYQVFDKIIDQAKRINYNGVFHKEIKYENFNNFNNNFNNILFSIFERCFEKTKILYKDFISKIRDMNLPIKVIFMREGKLSKRTEYGSKNKIQFFSGQSNKKGDRVLPNYPNNYGCILLEVYKFEVVSSDGIQTKEGIFYAIYIPGQKKGCYINAD